jgi:hypothetical protein
MMSPSPAEEQKLLLLRVAMWMLLGAALIVLLLPLPLPPLVRFSVAATDLVAAAVVWLARRQRLGPR